MSNESVTIPSSDEQRLALYKKIGVRAFLAVFGIMIVLAIGLMVAVVISLLVGHASLADLSLRSTLLELRGLRSAATAMAGAALAVAGVLVQGLFRNPLASPSVLGTTAGAALGGQCALYAHGALLAVLPAWLAPEMALPIGCLAGAGLSLVAVLMIAGRGTDVLGLLLTGFVLSSLLAGVGAVVTVLAQDSWQLGRAMLAFTLGGVSGVGVRQVMLALPLVVIGLFAAWSWTRDLDLLLCGEDEAASLGVDVASVRRWLLVWTAVLTAAAATLGAGVAFVGLVVPHALRPLIGAGHRLLLPAAAVGGAIFLVLADVVARALPGGEMPLGVITGLVGAPVFLVIFARARRSGEL